MFEALQILNKLNKMLSEILKKKGGNILSKEQQKNVVGGYGGGTCAAYLPPGWTNSTGSTIHTGPYDYHRQNADGSRVLVGLPRSVVNQLMFNSPGARWCCSSCGSATWI